MSNPTMDEQAPESTEPAPSTSPPEAPAEDVMDDDGAPPRPQPQKTAEKVVLTPPEPVEFEITYNRHYGLYGYASNKPGPLPKFLQTQWNDPKQCQEHLERYKKANGLT